MSKVISFRVTPKEEDTLLSSAPNGDLSFYVKSLVFDTHGDRSRILTLIKEKEAADRVYREAEEMRLQANNSHAQQISQHIQLEADLNSVIESQKRDAAERDRILQDLRDRNKTLGVRIESLEILNEKLYIEKESIDIPMINLENKVFKYRVATGIFAILFGFTLIALGVCLKTNLF